MWTMALTLTVKREWRGRRKCGEILCHVRLLLNSDSADALIEECGEMGSISDMRVADNFHDHVARQLGQFDKVG